METPPVALTLARTLAPDVGIAIPPADLARVVELTATPTQLAATARALAAEAGTRLDRDPRAAYGLGRVAQALAEAGTEVTVQAETALALATIANRLGEFHTARTLAERAAALYAPRGADDQTARSLCEAAWADTFIGDVYPASDKIDRARALCSAPLIRARTDWIAARVLRDQGRYPEAIPLLENARTLYQDAQLPMQAARCECELAHVLILDEETDRALALLERARTTCAQAGCRLDAALCDFQQASSLLEADQYSLALDLLLRIKVDFQEQGAAFFVAWDDALIGICLRHLNRFDDSLEALHRARAYFQSNGIRAQVSATDVNLGNVYYVQNRYDRAFELYQEAADLSMTDGRETRAARIYVNMGLVRIKEGRFSQALDLLHRALQIATSKSLPLLAAGIHSSLGMCHRQLGQYDVALVHLEQARAKMTENHLREGLTALDIEIAEIHVARGETAQAIACLERARAVAAQEHLDSYVALCDRLLAQAAAGSENGIDALARVENARTLFRRHSQIVDAALCDLTQAQLHLAANEIAAAQDCFTRAGSLLAPAFPDQAWRAEYGLGHCAAARGDGAVALPYYLQAMRTIATSRSALVTEQISNDYFARRQSVFDDALALAWKQNVTAATLDVIEAAKARTFLTLLQNRDWRLRADHGDPYVADLIAREQSFRYRLDDLRGRVAVQAGSAAEPLREQAEMAALAGAALEQLNATRRDYEAVVAQLRLAQTGLAGVAVPAPFSLAEFRQAANAAFGRDWSALDYYRSADTLTIAIVGPESLSVQRKTLSPYDRDILSDCATADPELRELIYRGTLSRDPMPSPGTDYMQHLHDLLIPDGLGATLIVSPHGSLHALPFQALTSPRDGSFLIERHTLLHTPNLQALQLLLDGPAGRAVGEPLIVGLSDFAAPLHPLAFSAAEVEQVRLAFSERGVFLWGEQATRSKLLDLSASGKLREYDVVHLSTHALVDAAAPHRSRIQLSDAALTTTDIVDLSLDARLVTLSACQSALAQGGTGDELIGLARAFFYAGARALLGTLWHVEDRATADLMGRFYRHYAAGRDAATALRQAQIEMIRDGSPPYHWAPFVLMGRP